jgi:hypothetical protein
MFGLCSRIVLPDAASCLSLGIFPPKAIKPLLSCIVRLYQTFAGEVAEWSKAHPC